MPSAPRAFALALLVPLVLFGQVHAQQLLPSPATSSMPSPVLLTDPGARCSGWLPCPTIDAWDLTLRVDPFYASPAAGRGEAGGVRAVLDLDVAHQLEGGISAAVLTWITLDSPPQRGTAWSVLGAHVRGAVHLGGLDLVGTYEHLWSQGSAGYGLLTAGGSAGRARAAIHLPLHSTLFHTMFGVGAAGGVQYNEAGALAGELGLHLAAIPDDPGHLVSLWLEGGVLQPVRGVAGAPGAWAALGFSSVSSGGGELGGALRVDQREGGTSLVFAFKFGVHFGQDYRPPEFLVHHQDPDELVTALAKRPQPLRALPPLLPRAQFARAGPPALPRPLGPQFPPGPAAAGPAAAPLSWYPSGQPEPPQPAQAGPSPRRPMLADLAHPGRTHWGQPFRPVRLVRPPPRAIRAAQGPVPRGAEAERDADAEVTRIIEEGGGRVDPVENEPPRLRPSPEAEAARHEQPAPRPAPPVAQPAPSAAPARAQAPWGAGGPPPWERPAPEPAVAEHAPPPPARSQAPPTAGTAAPAQALSGSATRGGAGPVRQGQAGVATVVKQLQQPGRQVDTEVTLKTSQGPRRIDVLVTEANGQRTAYEVKTGNSPYKPIQVSKDGEMATQGAIPTGKRAAAAGLGNGPVQIPTKLIRLK